MIRITIGDKENRINIRGGRGLGQLAPQLPNSVYMKRYNLITIPIYPDSIIALRKRLKVMKYSIDDDARDLINEVLENERQLRASKKKIMKVKKQKHQDILPYWTDLTLYSHQYKAFRLALINNNFGLFMEQGTGKTLPTLGVIIERGVKRVLYVCPKAVMYEIRRQINEHILVKMNPIVVDCESKDFKFKIKEEKEGYINVYLVNYEKLWRLKRQYLDFEMMIVDESHKIKDRTTKQTKFITELGQSIKYKMILTGTPIGNSVEDLFSQFLFLEPSIFGSSYKRFADKYLEFGMYNEVVGSKNLSEIKEKVKEVTYRITKRKCLDIKEPVVEFLRIPLEDSNRKEYRQMAKDIITFGDTIITTDFAMNNIMKRYQILNGWIYDNDKNVIRLRKNPKLRLLMETIEYRKSLGKKTIVFVYFKEDREIIMEEFESKRVSYCTIDNHLDFNRDPSIDVALIQMQAGAEGIDLTASDMEIFYSVTPSYLQYSQCIGRADRRGQKEPFITILHLITEGTVEQDCYDILSRKKDLSDEVIDIVRK